MGNFYSAVEIAIEFKEKDGYLADLNGHFILSKNNIIIGYVNEKTGPQHKAIIYGKYFKEENRLAFIKLPINPYLSPLLYVWEDTGEDGQWFRYNPNSHDFNMNGICAGLTRILVKESKENPIDIINEYNNRLDEASPKTFDLIKKYFLIFVSLT